MQHIFTSCQLNQHRVPSLGVTYYSEYLGAIDLILWGRNQEPESVFGEKKKNRVICKSIACVSL
jgi:hypothetical protein